jgi:hypothetical protein
LHFLGQNPVPISWDKKASQAIFHSLNLTR